MNLGNKARKILTHEGITGLARGIGRFVYWRSGIRKARYKTGFKLHRGPVSRTIDGTAVRFYLSSWNEYARVQSLQGERKIIADVLQSIKGDDIFFDVGANTGLYACFAGQIIDGNVIAFEPHPGNIQRLEENAELNELDIQCHPVALSNESGTAQLKLAGGEGGAGAGTHALSTRDCTNSIEIEKDRGDSLIERENIPSPTVLKIDVEGAEQQVLKGLQSNLMKDSCHTVYCEVHPNRLDDFGDSTDELHSLLEECGFKIEIIERRSPQYFIKAEKEF